MRVENENDRMEMPEECDNCGSEVPLTRYYNYGPGHNVKWLCHYCDLDHTQGESVELKSIAAMLNELERTLAAK